MQRYFFIAICALFAACNPYERDIKHWEQLVEQAERIELSAPSAAYLLLDSVEYPVLMSKEWLVRYCQVACRLADSIHTPLPYLYDLDFALYRAEQTKDLELQAQMGFYLGRSMQEEGLSQPALETFTEAEARSQAAGNLHLSARISQEIGHLYETKGNHPQAKVWRQQSLRLFGQANDVKGQAEAWYLLGKTYAAQDSFQLTSACILQSDSLIWQVGDTVAIVALYNKVGEIYQTAGLFPEAKQAFRRAVSLSPSSKNPPVFLALGTIYLQEDSLKQAEQWLREARKSAMPSDIYTRWLRQFAELERKRGRYQSALDTLEKYVDRRKSYVAQRKKDYLREENKLFERRQVMIENYRLHKEQSYIIFSILLFVCLISVLVLLLRRRIRLQKGRLLYQKQMIIQMEQHLSLKENELARISRQLAERQRQNQELAQIQVKKQAEIAQLAEILFGKEAEKQRLSTLLTKQKLEKEDLEQAYKRVSLEKESMEKLLVHKEEELKQVANLQQEHQQRSKLLAEEETKVQAERAAYQEKIRTLNCQLLEGNSIYKKIKTLVAKPSTSVPFTEKDRKAVRKLLDSLYPALPQLLQEAGFTPTEQFSCYLAFFELTPKEEAMLLGIQRDSVDKTHTRVRRKLQFHKTEGSLLFYFLERL